MPRQNIPSYRLHKPTGQAIVVLRGKMFYLGQYKSKASKEEYNALIAEYLANHRQAMLPLGRFPRTGRRNHPYRP